MQQAMRGFDAGTGIRQGHSYIRVVARRAGPRLTLTQNAPNGPQGALARHCIRAALVLRFTPSLDPTRADMNQFAKGNHPLIDSYSASSRNDQKTPTGLEGSCAQRHYTVCTMVGFGA